MRLRQRRLCPSETFDTWLSKKLRLFVEPPSERVYWQEVRTLTVLSYVGKHKGNHIWHCWCDCGNKTDVRQSDLQNGSVKSCGCLKWKDISGQRFGRLTAGNVYAIVALLFIAPQNPYKEHQNEAKKLPAPNAANRFGGMCPIRTFQKS